MLMALVLGLIGLLLLAGGVWLIGLGGSPYYAVAGFLLLVTSALMFSGDEMAIWVYLLTFAFTLVWALWERGLNGWAQVPRLLGPVILLVLVLLTRPVLHALRPVGWRIRPGTAASVMAIIGILIVVPVGLQHRVALAQGTPPLAPGASGSAAGGADMGRLPGEDWPVYGGTNLAARYSSLDQIATDNVGKLKQVWQYRTGDLPDKEELQDKFSPEATPIKVGNTLFMCSARNIILAIDAVAGKEAWRYDPQISDDVV
jgi:quinoprotein glucose dehydrogenase